MYIEHSTWSICVCGGNPPVVVKLTRGGSLTARTTATTSEELAENGLVDCSNDDTSYTA